MGRNMLICCIWFCVMFNHFSASPTNGDNTATSTSLKDEHVHDLAAKFSHEDDFKDEDADTSFNLFNTHASKDEDFEDGVKANQNNSSNLPCYKKKMSKAGILKLIKTVERMLDHFALYTDQIIADGLLGLRVTEVALWNIADKMNAGNTYYPRMKNLYDRIRKINAEAFRKIHQEGKKYTKSFEKMLRRLPKDYLYPQRSLKDLEHLYEEGSSNVIVEEAVSDRCYTNLLGTGPDAKGKACTVSKKCLQLESAPHRKDYTLTHQFLYFLIGVKNGCTKQLAKAMGGKQHLKNLMEKFATNIAMQRMKANQPQSMRDLDMHTEQIFMCGIFGIVECTDVGLINQVTPYINPVSGCTESIHMKGTLRRQKRIDLRLGGCSQHLDGLHIAVLSMALKSSFEVPLCK